MGDATAKSLNFYKGGVFYILGEFDDTISTDIIPELVQKINEEKNKKQGMIEFQISSRGGNTWKLFDLLSLIEQAKRNGIIVKTVVTSIAYSCGSMLAASGTKGHRFIGEHAEHLCHLGDWESSKVMNEEQTEREALKLKEHFKKIRNLYKKYANIKNLDGVINNDRYYIRGKDIVKNGLADILI